MALKRSRCVSTKALISVYAGPARRSIGVAAGPSTRALALVILSSVTTTAARPAAAWWQVLSSRTISTPDAASAVANNGSGTTAVAGQVGDDFTVVLLSDSGGAEIWRAEINGTGSFGAAQAVAFDGSGDVFAAGSVVNTGTGSDFAVVKLAGATGAVIWRKEINGTANAGDGATSVTVDASGDVIAAGVLQNGSSSYDFAVVKLAGATGAEIWRKEINGTANSIDQASFVTVDAAGDVIAGGYLENAGTSYDFAVVKLTGATGAEIWRKQINGTDTAASDQAFSVVVDTAGDVIAAGTLTNTGTFTDFIVVKLSGGSGSEIWRNEIDSPGNLFDLAYSVAVDTSGDVIAAGRFSNGSTPDFAVVKLAGAGGAELWRTEIDGTAGGFEEVLAVSIDGANDVIAAGYLLNASSSEDFAVVKFSGATGTEIWRNEIDGTAAGVDRASSVTLDGSGNVVAAGYLQNAGTDSDFSVVKLSATAGTEMWRAELDGTRDVPYKGEALAAAVDAGGDILAAGWLSTGFSGASVVKLSGATGAEIWRTAIDWGGRMLSVAVDGSGDVVAAGYFDGPSATFSDFAVIKISGATGAEIWRKQIDGTSGNYDYAFSVSLDGSGDVVAAGYLNNSGTSDDFTVVKLSGATGAELWRREIDGTANTSDQALGVSFDASGDVIAVGHLTNISGGTAFGAIKFSGLSGAEVWRKEINGTSGIYCSALAVALDSSGNVIAAGLIGNADTGEDFAVVKLAGATGADLWRTEINETGNYGAASAVTIDASGDVVAAGSLSTSRGSTFGVVKLSGSTGSQLWRKKIRGGPGSTGAALSVGVDSAGDVFAAGSLNNSGTGGDFTTVKLSGTKGAELWRREIDGAPGYGDQAHSLTVSGNGDVVVAGRLQNYTPNSPFSDYDFTVIKLSGADGGSWGGMLASPKLIVKDDASLPERRRLVVLFRDADISTPAPGSAGDPTLHGAELHLINPSTSESAVFTLPAGSSWSGLGNPPGSRGYKYRDSTGTNGPCKLLLAISGKRLRAVCAGASIPFTLDEPMQGSLLVSAQFGSADAQCARYGGYIKKDQGIANPGPKGTFLAARALSTAAPCQ